MQSLPLPSEPANERENERTNQKTRNIYLALPYIIIISHKMDNYFKSCKACSLTKAQLQSIIYLFTSEASAPRSLKQTSSWHILMLSASCATPRSSHLIWWSDVKWSCWHRLAKLLLLLFFLHVTPVRCYGWWWYAHFLPACLLWAERASFRTDSLGKNKSLSRNRKQLVHGQSASQSVSQSVSQRSTCYCICLYSNKKNTSRCK